MESIARIENAFKEHNKLAKLIAFIGFVILAIQVTHKKQGDYAVTYRAGLRIWTSEMIYRLDEPHPYMYSPIFAFIISPISYVGLIGGSYGYTVSKFLYFLLSFCCLIGAVLVLKKILKSCVKTDYPLYILAIPVLLTARLILNTFQHGQSNLILLVLLLSCCWFSQTGRWSKAGIALFVAASIKFVLVLIFVPYFLLKRQMQMVGLFTLLLGISFLAPALLHGWDRNLELHREWLHVLAVQANDRGDQQSYLNQSPLGFAIRVAGDARSENQAEEQDRDPYSILFGLVFVIVVAWFVCGVIALHRGRSGNSPELQGFTEFCLLLLLMIIISPVSWKHYFAIWLAPLSVVCLAIWKRHPHTQFFLTVLGVVLVFVSLASSGVIGHRAAMLLQTWGSMLWCNMLIIVCLADLLLARHPLCENRSE